MLRLMARVVPRVATRRCVLRHVSHLFFAGSIYPTVNPGGKRFLRSFPLELHTAAGDKPMTFA